MTSPNRRDPATAANFDAALGYSLLRLTLGLNLLFHSFQRWRDLGPFVEGVVRDFARTPLPAWSVRAFATASRSGSRRSACCSCWDSGRGRGWRRGRSSSRL